MTRRGSPRPVLAVLILGLADVTAIACTHGQGIGDELLRIVGARLVRALRAQDLVTRLWSDEYACLLADVPSREQLGRLACKLHDIVAAPIHLGTLELSMRPSIGISASPGDADNADSMLVCADVAMCRARHQNCSYAFFDASLQADHAPRLQA
jgi:diguanylate cyclase (GGDEF)-like protein